MSSQGSACLGSRPTCSQKLISFAFEAEGKATREWGMGKAEVMETEILQFLSMLPCLVCYSALLQAELMEI